MGLFVSPWCSICFLCLRTLVGICFFFVEYRIYILFSSCARPGGICEWINCYRLGVVFFCFGLFLPSFKCCIIQKLFFKKAIHCPSVVIEKNISSTLIFSACVKFCKFCILFQIVATYCFFYIFVMCIGFSRTMRDGSPQHVFPRSVCKKPMLLCFLFIIGL